jgi:hypothetical protein
MEGARTYADWLRLNLAEVYLQIIMGNEKPPLPILLKNLPIILRVMLTASSRIRALVTHALANPRFDPAGHFVGRAQMLLGLLYKIKKKRVSRPRAFDRVEAHPLPIRTNALARAGRRGARGIGAVAYATRFTIGSWPCLPNC